jgi:NAD(P)-dependent dehydrogenase (short-subunit alcohol dehydrogenase family)
MLGMVESHVVWLKFEADSGFGEQILYFGLDDHLLRKATLVIPETRLEGEPGDAMATNPAMYVDLTMTEVQVLSVVPDSAFNTSHAGFQEIIVGRDKPSVGVYLVTRAVVALIPPGGRIVNMSSVLGRFGVSGYTAYCASKHGVIGFTRALALELTKRRVTVNALCPGWVNTAMTTQGMLQGAAATGKTVEQFREQALGAVPIGRIIEPAEVAELVRFVASPATAAVTGQTYNICGGQTMD